MQLSAFFPFYRNHNTLSAVYGYLPSRSDHTTLLTSTTELAGGVRLGFGSGGFTNGNEHTVQPFAVHVHPVLLCFDDGQHCDACPFLGGMLYDTLARTDSTDAAI